MVGILSLLAGVVGGAAAIWAFMILPRSLPSVTALETFQPLQGTKVYDDNDELITELTASAGSSCRSPTSRSHYATR